VYLPCNIRENGRDREYPTTRNTRAYIWLEAIVFPTHVQEQIGMCGVRLERVVVLNAYGIISDHLPSPAEITLSGAATQD